MFQQDTDRDTMETSGKSIDGFIETLNELTEGAENDFMLLGLGLQTVHVNVKELTQLMLDTVKRIGGHEEGGIIKRVDHTVNESLKEIRNFHAEVNTNLTQINTVVGKISDLYATSEQIKKFAKFLNAVAFNMFVENARVMDSANIFSDIAQEIKDLAFKITGIANDVYDNVERSREIHMGIHEKISKGMDMLQELTGDVQTAVRASVMETEQLMYFSLDTIEQAGVRSQEITQQVGEIVVGVQYHDNMRQQLLKITDTLTNIENISDKVSDNYEFLFAEIISEVEDVYHKNLNAIYEIKNEVEVLVESFLGLKSDDMESSGVSNILSDDPFSSLKSVLMQLYDLLDQGRGLFEQLQEAAGQAADIATKLSDLLNIIRGISSETHNKALNSIIAAQRMGDKGRTLKLLAQEMNDLATKSDVFVDEVEEIIETIVVSATEIGQRDIKGFETMSSDGGAISKMDEVINNISGEYDQFRQDSIDAYERAKALKKAINTTIVSLEFFNGLSKGLTTHKEQLKEILFHENAGIREEKRIPKTRTVKKENVVISLSEAMEKRKKTVENGLGDNVEIF